MFDILSICKKNTPGEKVPDCLQHQHARHERAGSQVHPRSTEKPKAKGVDFPLSRVALNLRSKGRGPGQEGRLQECQGIGDQHFSTIMIIDEDGPITMIIIIAITIMIDKKYAQGGGWLRRTLPRSH